MLLQETALCSLLDRQPELLEKYLEEHASEELITRLIRRYQRLGGDLAVIPRSPMSPLPIPYNRTESRASLAVSEQDRSKRTSVASEIFHTWLGSSPTKRAKSPNR